MRKEKYQERLAALLGIDLTEIPSSDSVEEARRDADVTILYLDDPTRFRRATCRQCSRDFATNYSAVAMCSDKCRIEYLRNMGIEWDRTKTREERWKPARVPLVCPPEALAVADEALRREQSGPAGP